MPLGLRPRFHSQSNKTIHSGTVVTSKAARPDGMYCSAQATLPVPTSNSIPPTTAAVRH